VSRRPQPRPSQQTGAATTWHPAAEQLDL
jgi:hypothetical protein